MNENVLLLVVGIILISVGLYRYRLRLRYRQTGIGVDAVVVDLSNERGGYFPILNFKTLSGREISKKYEMGSRPAAYQVGEVVKVFYLENDPESFVLDGRRSINGDLLWLVLGGILSAVAVYLLFFKV